jgi:antitoxin ParD1/3/4
MPSSYTLGRHFEDFIQNQLRGGRYNNARERRLTALDAALAEGLADIEAGRVYELRDVCDELEAEIAALPDTPRQ